jgi:ABC-2 type transport system ATP-binding protein
MEAWGGMMLEARNLSKSYSSVPAVEAVSFAIEPGQILGCLGPNGSGKSTTVKMLLGLIDPTRGQVFFDGEDISRDLAAYRKQLGYVPEEPNLYPYLSGREYLELVGTLRGMERRRRDAKIDALLEQFAMYPHRHGTIGAYSKGMRQRILIIAALMDNPRLLIFDEPLSGLDVVTALVFKNLVRSLGEQGKAVFYCSHVLEVLEKVCSHLIILRRGEVVTYGAAKDLPRVSEEASLEQTFAHLVTEVDADQLARNIVDAMVNA